MKKILISTFFLIYFLIGFLIYKDFGIGIEEHFQRKNGFYWLKEMFSFFNLNNLKILALEKYVNSTVYDPTLPDSVFFNYYGIFFDLPAAFLELFFKIEQSKIYFELRHLLNFIIFFISSIYFYKILQNRFKSLIISFSGAFIYVASPRIFGDSFHNNKDILFLSLLTVATFFLFKYMDKYKIKNLFLFCLFAAFATSSRIMGVYLPILFIFFLSFEYLAAKIPLIIFIKRSILIIFCFLFFLYLHFPYMWELNIFKFIDWFKVFFYHMDLKILFNGTYYNIKYLPRLYLPTWIVITTPISILILFLIGYFLLVKRFFQRILNISITTKLHNDLYRSINEKKDLFIFISLTCFLVYAVFLNVAMLSGWRHFYFLQLFIAYISMYALNFIYILIKIKKINVIFFKSIIFFLILSLVLQIYLFHPYQSLYFNNLVKFIDIKKLPVDTSSLSRSESLRDIVNLSKGSNRIYIANASWTPYWNGKDLLNDAEQKKLIFVGQEYHKADFIYTNFLYEINPTLSKKYNIPDNFKEVKNKTINGIHVYSIYERIK